MAGLIFKGNVKLLACFAFYMAWWIVAFNPKRPIRGVASAWLLVPALVLGVLALIDIARGIVYVGGPLPGFVIVVGGVVCYLMLLGITYGLLRRPVTSELLIIVLWATVALLEVNTLQALGAVTPTLGAALMKLCLVFSATSIVCYQLFYGLDEGAAFVDGTIPLVLAAIMTSAIAFFAHGLP